MRISSQSYPDKIIPNLFLGNLSHAQNFIQKIIGQDEPPQFGLAILMCIELDLDIEINDQLAKQMSYGNIKKLSISDSLDENISNYFSEAFDYIETALNNKKIVLVHCGSGISRSPTIIISYLMKKYQLRFEESYNYVFMKHPSTYPNENFIRQLKEYELQLTYQNLSNSQKIP
jgi:predicted protein tyrosine phosphatase